MLNDEEIVVHLRKDPWPAAALCLPRPDNDRVHTLKKDETTCPECLAIIGWEALKEAELEPRPSAVEALESYDDDAT